MKMLLAAAALAALLASDALARSHWRSAYRSYGLWLAPGHAYALAAFHGRRSLYRTRNVYDTSGFFIGRDPDANVRFALQRDPETGVTRSIRRRR
jgi:opacity protein-like surface antigen